jgi:translation elongation factor P/translation initiation factor 5A
MIDLQVPGAEIRTSSTPSTYPGAAVVKLEQNYRSTGTILDAAAAVIANNAERKGKSLWTQNARGEKIDLFHAADDRAEATWVARCVTDEARRRPYEDIAVLYRTNAQSRSFEEAFRRDRIPYHVVGAMQFYERKEVKDILAYLKLAVNPGDDVAFRRIVNVPPRGIGDTTVDAIETEARAEGVALRDAARRLVDRGALGARASRLLGAFLETTAGFAARAAEEPAALVIEGIVEGVGFPAYLEKSYPGEGFERMENVRSLVSAAVEYEREVEAPTSSAFWIVRPSSRTRTRSGRPGVTLMTVHNAKGLEFSVVFLAGLEENIFRTLGRKRTTTTSRRSGVSATWRSRGPGRGSVSPARCRAYSRASPRRTRLRGSSKRSPPGCSRRAARASRHRSSTRRCESRAGGWRDFSLRVLRRPRRRAPSPLEAAPHPSFPVAEDGFSVGVKVSHPMFGSGRIPGARGAGKSLKLTIQFSGTERSGSCRRTPSSPRKGRVYERQRLAQGMVIRFEGLVYKVLESTHRTPGNLRAFVQAKLRNVMTGLHRATVPVRGRHREGLPRQQDDAVHVSRRRGYHFMDTDTYDQFALADDVLGDTMSFVIPESTVTMDWFEGSRSASRSRRRSTSRSSKRRPASREPRRPPRRSPPRSKPALSCRFPRSSTKARSSASAPRTATTSGEPPRRGHSPFLKQQDTSAPAFECRRSVRAETGPRASVPKRRPSSSDDGRVSRGKGGAPFHPFIASAAAAIVRSMSASSWAVETTPLRTVTARGGRARKHRVEEPCVPFRVDRAAVA